MAVSRPEIERFEATNAPRRWARPHAARRAYERDAGDRRSAHGNLCEAMVRLETTQVLLLGGANRW